MPWLLALLVLAAQALPARATLPPTAGAVIRGRVTDRQTGRPLAGIVVRIPSARADQPVIETRTAADGTYELTGVPAGSHFLVALMPQFRLTHFPQVYGDLRPPRMRWSAGNPPRIEIEDGAVMNGVDFSLVRALGVSGRVVDGAGRPMSGVDLRVEVLGRGDVGAGGYRQTDDRGNFRVFGLAPGRYRICADPGRLVYTDRVPPDMPAAACYPSSRASEGLVLDTADPEPITIVMRRGGTVTVSGTVVDASGLPAEGASLRLVRPGPPGAAWADTRIPIWPGARFVAHGVSPGDYVIEASGGRAVDNGLIIREQYASVPVHVGTENVAVTIQLRKLVNVTGRVRLEGGQPLPPGTAITVDATMNRRMSAVVGRSGSTTALRDDLTFDLQGLLGDVSLWFHGLPAGWFVESVHDRGVDVTDRPLTQVEGDAPIDVVLSSRGALVSGTVEDDSGAVAAGQALVWIYSTDASQWARERPLHACLAARTGTFSLEAVRPGEYFVTAFDARMRDPDEPLRPTLERLSRTARRIMLSDGARRTIDLRITKSGKD